jgi:hypothetical protein
MADTLVQRRRGGGGVPPIQPPPLRRSASAASDMNSPSQAPGGGGGLKAWQLWMMFGLGWPSVLLFFLSVLPSFSGTVKGWLLVFGWACCASWLAAVLAGLAQDRPSKAQAAAHTANLIMAVIGCALGCVFLSIYAYWHWPTLYLAALLAGLGIMYAAKSVLGDDAGAPGAGGPGAAGEGGDGGDDAAAGVTGAEGGLQQQGSGSLSRAISAPQAATLALLEQQQRAAAPPADGGAAGHAGATAALAAAASAPVQPAGGFAVPGVVLPPGSSGVLMSLEDAVAAGYVQPDAPVITLEDAVAQGLVSPQSPGSPLILASPAASPVPMTAPGGCSGGAGLTMEQAAIAAGLMVAPAGVSC